MTIDYTANGSILCFKSISTAVAEGISLGTLDPTVLLYGGWAIVLGAAGAGAGGGALLYIAVVAEWIGEWLVDRETRGK